MSNEQVAEHIAEWEGIVQEATTAYESRHFTEAELKFAAALRIAEKDAHADELAKLDASEHDGVNLRLAKSLNNMAALYHTQGKYSMAEDLYKRCLELKQKMHGEEHIEVAINLHNLAALYSAKRRYEQAEPLYKRALELRERLLGEEHPDLLTLLNNYALLLKRTDRAEEASKLEERATKIAQPPVEA